MKIILPTNSDRFRVTPGTFCGVNSFHIIPEIDAKWTKENLFYRSVIVDKKNKVLSCGFPKFFNYGENNECYPLLEGFKDWEIYEKIDGTLLIADYVNKQFNMRTRGTFSYKTQKNFKDFEKLIEICPEVVNFLENNAHLSLLFEIVTPNNVIVVRPSEIKFYLLGGINKNNLSVLSHQELITIQEKLKQIPTPEIYEGYSTMGLTSIIKLIKEWKGKEGIVVVYNKGQNRVKIKSDWYCWIHRVKSRLNTSNNLLDYFIEKNYPEEEEFFEMLKKDFDYEIAIQLKVEIKKIATGWIEFKQNIEKIKEFVQSIRNIATRKQQAECIKITYKDSHLRSLAFNILDSKRIDIIQIKKILLQKIDLLNERH